ncbi:MAG: hypothetical protein WD847_19470 [Pirellulales bacterium]
MLTELDFQVIKKPRADMPQPSDDLCRAVPFQNALHQPLVRLVQQRSCFGDKAKLGVESPILFNHGNQSNRQRCQAAILNFKRPSGHRLTLLLLLERIALDFAFVAVDDTANPTHGVLLLVDVVLYALGKRFQRAGEKPLEARRFIPRLEKFTVEFLLLRNVPARYDILREGRSA